MGCGVVAVVVVGSGSRSGALSKGSADYGLRGNGIMRIVYWAWIGRGRGMQVSGFF